jgi:hypothetical protein
MQVVENIQNNIISGGRCVLTTAYLPPVDYFIALANADEVLIEQWEFYQKQSYRNRCTIATANGALALSIPVEKPSGNKTFIRDVRISEHGNWQLQHWRALESAYLSSPFFEFYADDLRPCFEKKYEFLFDFNTELLHRICDLIEIQPIINLTNEYRSHEAEVSDFRELIHPKKTVNIFPARPYYQVFQSKFGFIPGLSIVDLLFNKGNESIFILKCL